MYYLLTVTILYVLSTIMAGCTAYTPVVKTDIFGDCDETSLLGCRGKILKEVEYCLEKLKNKKRLSYLERSSCENTVERYREGSYESHCIRICSQKKSEEYQRIFNAHDSEN